MESPVRRLVALLKEDVFENQSSVQRKVTPKNFARLREMSTDELRELLLEYGPDHWSRKFILQHFDQPLERKTDESKVEDLLTVDSIKSLSFEELLHKFSIQVIPPHHLVNREELPNGQVIFDWVKFPSKRVVVKYLSQSLNSDELAAKLQTFSSFNSCAFVLHLVGAFADENQAYLVFEYPDGSLGSYLTAMRETNKLIPQKDMTRCFLHIAKGLEEILDRGHILYDLSLDNCFIFVENRSLGIKKVKIGLFDIYVRGEDRPLPIERAAPEVCKEGQFSVASNIFSLGITFCDILTEKRSLHDFPMASATRETYINRFSFTEVSLLRSIKSKSLASLTVDCMSFDPNRRNNMKPVIYFLTELYVIYRGDRNVEPIGLRESKVEEPIFLPQEGESKSIEANPYNSLLTTMKQFDLCPIVQYHELKQRDLTSSRLGFCLPIVCGGLRLSQFIEHRIIPIIRIPKIKFDSINDLIIWMYTFRGKVWGELRTIIELQDEWQIFEFIIFFYCSPQWIHDIVTLDCRLDPEKAQKYFTIYTGLTLDCTNIVEFSRKYHVLSKELDLVWIQDMVEGDYAQRMKRASNLPLLVLEWLPISMLVMILLDRHFDEDVIKTVLIAEKNDYDISFVDTIPLGLLSATYGVIKQFGNFYPDKVHGFRRLSITQSLARTEIAIAGHLKETLCPGARPVGMKIEQWKQSHREFKEIYDKHLEIIERVRRNLF